MELNKIKKLQYNNSGSDTSSGTPPATGGSGILNTILVSDFNGNDYPDNTPYSELAVPFKTLIRARDYLVANNLIGYTIKVLPGIYYVNAGENMDHRGVWQLEDNVTINVRIGRSLREYLFTGSYPPLVIGKGRFVFFNFNGGLYYPYNQVSPNGLIEAKSVEARGSVLGTGVRGYYGGWCILRNINFISTTYVLNLFTETNIKGQVFMFDNCTFSDYYIDIENYSQLNFNKCSTYGFIGSPAITLGAGSTSSPTNYACNFQDCDFDLHSNGIGGILLKSEGVRLCVTRSRFNRGTSVKYAIKSDFDNIVAIDAVSTSPIKGTGKLKNIIDKGFEYIDPLGFPYLLTL